MAQSDPVLTRRHIVGGFAVAIAAWDAPARAAGTLSGSGDPLVLEAADGQIRLDGEGPTPVWCYGGHVPGPILRARRSGKVFVRLVNRLAVPMSIHWRGARIANAVDGVAGLTQPAVLPGQSFDYRFSPPDSGTFLYQAGAQAGTPSHEAPGLAGGLHGLLIVEDPDEQSFDHEVLLVAQAWRRDARPRAETADGAATRVVSANGSIEPAMQALPQGARVRVRLANASDAAVLLLDVQGASIFVLAIDGQPCPTFQPGDILPIGPGARFDLAVDMPHTSGAQVTLSLRDPAASEAPPAVVVLRADSRNGPTASRRMPAADNPALPSAIALENAARVDLMLADHARIARRGSQAPQRTAAQAVLPTLDPNKPHLAVRRGRPVVIGLINPSNGLKSVHIHGHAVRVLHDLDDGWHPYWRDSILVEPSKTHHVAFVADNPGKWLVECVDVGTAMHSYAWFAVD